jgi:hypothetical protein
MAERLVDVLTDEKIVLHTYPITIGKAEAVVSDDSEFEKKAAEAAAYAHLVPDGDLPGLSEKMHVMRSGRLEPFGDEEGVMSQTKEALDNCIRADAYETWQREGCPEGRSGANWLDAEERHLRVRAYGLWEQEGCPEGMAEENWRRTRAFEAV